MIVALDSDEDPITLFGNMPILSLLIRHHDCIRPSQIGPGSERGTNDPSDPAHEISLRVIIVMLKDNSFSDDYPLIPRCHHHALLTGTAAQTALDQAPSGAAPAGPTDPDLQVGRWLVTAWASGPARAGGSCGNCHRRMFCYSSVAFLTLRQPLRLQSRDSRCNGFPIKSFSKRRSEKKIDV